MSRIASTPTPTTRSLTRSVYYRCWWPRSAPRFTCATHRRKCRRHECCGEARFAQDALARAPHRAARLRHLRPAAELAAMGVCRALVLPVEAAVAVWADVLVPRVPAARQRACLPGDKRVDRAVDGGGEPRGRSAGWLRVGAAQASLAQRDPARLSAATSRAESA